MSGKVDCVFDGDEVILRGSVLGEVRFELDEIRLFLRESSYVEVEDSRCRVCADEFEGGWKVDGPISFEICSECRSEIISNVQNIVEDNITDVVGANM